jgi:hypothetical protein
MSSVERAAQLSVMLCFLRLRQRRVVLLRGKAGTGPHGESMGIWPLPPRRHATPAARPRLPRIGLKIAENERQYCLSRMDFFGLKQSVAV